MKPRGLKQVFQLGMEVLIFQSVGPQQRWVIFISLKEAGNGQKWGILSPPNLKRCAGRAEGARNTPVAAEGPPKFAGQYFVLFAGSN